MSVLIDDGKAEEEDIMKCDIGELVDIIEKLKKHLSPVLKIAGYGISIFRWERPLLTILSMIACCSIFIINPVYMIICILLPIPPWLVIEYVRTCGKRKVPTKSYANYIQQKDEAYQQLLKRAAQEKQRENLNLFLDNLIGLQRIFHDIIEYFEHLESVITWKRKRWSLLVLLGSLLIEFMLYLLDVRIVLCFITLCWFLVNRYFVLAIKNSINGGKTFIYSLYQKSPKRIKNEIDKNTPLPPIVLEEKIETMQPEDIETSSTSETDDDGENKKEASSNASRNHPAGSLMSIFIPRSLRRRYISSGNCSKCDQPASTILKKRRYCRHCGNSFCSRCCNLRVPRSFLGATAPAAYQEKVLVCEACHVFLTNRMTTPSELVE